MRSKPVDNITESNTRTSQAFSSNKQPSAAEHLLSTNKSRARFQNWLKNKQSYDSSDNIDQGVDQEQKASSEVYNSERYTDNCYLDKSYRDHSGSGDVNVLRVPSTRPPGFASPDQGFNSEDETGEITAATLMSPEDFDSRADDIIAKVKGDMKITHTRGYDNFEEVRKSIPGDKTAKNKISHTEGNLSSHVCPTCDKLMVCETLRYIYIYICIFTCTRKQFKT